MGRGFGSELNVDSCAEVRTVGKSSSRRRGRTIGGLAAYMKVKTVPFGWQFSTSSFTGCPHRLKRGTGLQDLSMKKGLSVEIQRVTFGANIPRTSVGRALSMKLEIIPYGWELKVASGVSGKTVGN